MLIRHVRGQKLNAMTKFISRAPFMAYKQWHKKWQVFIDSRQQVMQKPKAKTIQAHATMKSIIHMIVDQMLH